MQGKFSHSTTRLDDVLITSELAARLAPPADSEAELNALHAIGRAMANGPDFALQALVEAAVTLCSAGSAGVSLLDGQADCYRWVAIAGAWAPFAGGSSPGSFSPCGTTTARGTPQLFSYPGRLFGYLGDAMPVVVESLVVPFKAVSESGTIWVIAHDEGRKFTAEDERLLTRLADFTAAAVLSQANHRRNDEAMNRLAEREAQQTRVFETTLSSIVDFAYIFDLEGRFKYINSALLNLWGRTLEQSVGKNFFELDYPTELAAKLQRQIQEVIDTGRVLTDETPYVSPTGAGGYYEYIFTPIFTADGTVEAVAGSTRDITTRKKAEAEREHLQATLEAERSKLAGIIEQAPAFICILKGPQHVFEIANDRYYEIVGRRKLIGLPVREALPEVVGQGFVELLDAVYQTGQTFNGSELPVHLHRRGEGMLEQRFMNLVYQPIRAADGQITGIFVHGVDVTDLVQAREDVSRNAGQFRTLADAMPQIVWAARPDGTLDYYNRKWFEYIGRSETDVEGATWDRYIYTDDLPRAYEIWANSIRTGEPYTIEFRIKRADGEYRWFLVRALAVKDDAGKVTRWFGTCTDVHDQRAMRSEKDQLLQRERLARAEAEAANHAKDRHLAFLAHELRGPLTPALLAATSIAADAQLPQQVRADAAVIRRNIELTTRLADDLLDANRIAHGKLELRIEPTDVHDTIRTAVDMCAADAAAKNVQLALDLTSRDQVVAADAPKLTQVWCNLLKNAIKFSEAGAAVTIRTSDSAGGKLRVEVVDSGAGVEPQLLSRMFNLYEQGSRSVTRQHAGLGLGLSICKGIVVAHGGTIVAASDGPGRGTTMTVELPANLPKSARPPIAAPVAARANVALNILLVDDHEDTLRMMSRLLSLLSHRVTVATGVNTALSAASNGDFDLLISDLGLGDGTGMDLMRELLKRRPIKGIALTGYGTASDVEATRSAGFVAHLTKPVNLDDLQAMILKVAT